MHAGKNTCERTSRRIQYIKSAKTEWKFVNFKNYRNVLENFRKF